WLRDLGQSLSSGATPTSSNSAPPVPRLVEMAKSFESQAVKKKLADEPPAAPTANLTPETVRTIWRDVLGQLGPMVRSDFEPAGLPAIIGPNHLVLHFPAVYNRQYKACAEPTRVQRVQEALSRLTGQQWILRVELSPGS